MRSVVIGLTLAVGFVLMSQYSNYLLFSHSWELKSTYPSPDGAFEIKHYESQTEAGHAPYGDNVVIEGSRGFPSDGSGETIFAGYCQGLSIRWVGNDAIQINCVSTDDDAIVTRSGRVFGKTVKVIAERPNEALQQTLAPAILFATAKSTSAASAAELRR